MEEFLGEWPLALTYGVCRNATIYGKRGGSNNMLGNSLVKSVNIYTLHSIFFVYMSHQNLTLSEQKKTQKTGLLAKFRPHFFPHYAWAPVCETLSVTGGPEQMKKYSPLLVYVKWQWKYMNQARKMYILATILLVGISIFTLNKYIKITSDSRCITWLLVCCCC